MMRNACFHVILIPYPGHMIKTTSITSMRLHPEEGHKMELKQSKWALCLFIFLYIKHEL